jgi:hypothetical protein
MAQNYDFGVSGLFPSKLGGTGTTIKYFPRLLGPSIGASPATPSATNATGALFIPPASVLNGQLFNVVAVGEFGNDTGDPSGTVNIQIRAVTPNATTGSYTVNPIYTTLASTGLLVPSPLGIVNTWAFRMQLYGSSLSGIVGGSYNAYVDGQLVTTPAAKSNVSTDTTLSGINFAGGSVPASLSSATGGPGTVGAQAPFGLVVGVTFGTSDATNTASMYEFMISTD